MPPSSSSSPPPSNSTDIETKLENVKTFVREEFQKTNVELQKINVKVDRIEMKLDKLLRDFGKVSVSRSFEHFCGHLLAEMYHVSDYRVSAWIGIDVVDVLMPDLSPVVAAECTLDLKKATKVHKAIKKKKAIEAVKQKPCTFYILANTISAAKVDEILTLAAENDIIVRHGLSYVEPEDGDDEDD